MKNYEKYSNEIREFKDSNFCDEFVVPHILKPNRRCTGTSCDLCHMIQVIWLMEEYEEPETDWSKVKVDTPILVRYTENEGEEWANGTLLNTKMAKYTHIATVAQVGVLMGL